MGANCLRRLFMSSMDLGATLQLNTLQKGKRHRALTKLVKAAGASDWVFE